MNWITRKVPFYLCPFLLYLSNSATHFFSAKNANTCILLADFSKYGGTRTYFEQLCSFLKQRYKKVVCLVTDEQITEELLEFIKKNQLLFDIVPTKEYEIEYFGKWTAKLLFAYFKNVLDELNRFAQVVLKYQSATLIISSGEPEKWLYLFLLPVKKCVYVLHTLPYRDIGKIGSFILRNKLQRNRSIVTVSNFAKASIISHWKIVQRCQKFVKVIPNYFEPVTDKNFVGKDESETAILTLGHVVNYKNPELWVQVAKAVLQKMPERNIQFIWAGDGKLIEQLRNEVREYREIRFIGYTKDVDNLYAIADIYLQPSQIESQGIAVIGAMYYSMPCVVSNSGGLPESVVDGVTGYVIQRQEVEGYVDKIVQLIQNEEVRIQMGYEGKRRFEEKFAKKYWVDQMKTLLAV